ncbi:hypothetical protein ABIB25_000793 [Nakamurella sp. UYEF19]|uniref:YciI family protein n=1 Tax=Nakamurella sp. UYEF19 TaxID=1756392 RepID=UPI003392E3E2
MKYMVMMFGSAAEMVEVQSPDWIHEMIEFMMGLNAELIESGELVSAEGLSDGSTAKVVRLEDGLPVVTDGPFAEAKESLIGFWILDVENEARIIEIAARIVVYSRQVEIRPIGGPPEV